MDELITKIKEFVKGHPVSTVATVTFLYVLYLFEQATFGRRRRDAKAGLPPGPLPMPIIGTFYELSAPGTQPGQHKDMFRLFQKFGPIFTLYFGANRGVVLNTPELYFEALNVKQDETAGRPSLKSYEAITHFQGVAMNNGPRWRMIRTILQQGVTNKQLGLEAEPVILEEVHATLAEIRDRAGNGFPVTDDLRLRLRREALNVISRKLFSIRFKEEMTPAFREVQSWMTTIFDHLALGSPSDFMPIMKYLPNSQEGHLRKVCAKMEAFIDSEIVRHRLEFDSKDKSEHDFIDKMLVAQKEAKKAGTETLEDIDIRVVLWDAMAGGIDTSASSMEWLCLLLCQYPEVQKKLHKVLDEVVGPDRLPTMEDEPKLEYLTAVIDELFRYKHFAPHGLPHHATVDMELGGYNIPKETQIFFNYHSLHMNPELWKNPEEFRPERFLEEERSLLKTILHSETYFTKPESYKFVPFGQGRRRCVGYGIGRIVMWLTAAMWIHTFDFEAPTEKPLDLDTEILGITMLPKKQEIKLTPRPAARLLRKYQKNPAIKEF